MQAELVTIGGEHVLNVHLSPGPSLSAEAQSLIDLMRKGPPAFTRAEMTTLVNNMKIVHANHEDDRLSLAMAKEFPQADIFAWSRFIQGLTLPSVQQ